MTDPTAAFAKMVPGFDFLQGLVKGAGAAMPNVGQWIAPTLNPEELEKRIEELRTVQFWLEQNVRMLGATIQALEVQRMTLSTLKTMNVSLGDLTESLKIRMPEPAPAPDEEDDEPEAAEPPPASPPPAAAPTAARRKASAAQPAAAGVPPGVVDPMQWWGALTQQFTQLAANAVKDTATDAARNLAGAMVKQGLDAAGETFKKAAAMPGAMAKTAAGAAQKMASAKPPARKRASAKRASPKPRSSGKAR
jgi:hypothetical protein